MPATVVLMIDGLPAHLPGPYGNATVDTPALNRLAAESMLFDFCFAESPKLSESYPLLFDGLVREGSMLVSDCADVLSIASEYMFDSIIDASGAEREQLTADVSQTQAASFFANAIEALQSLEDDSLCWLHHRGLYGPWDAPWEIRASFMGEDDPEPPTTVGRPIGTFDSASDDPDVLLGYQQSAYAQVVAIDQLLSVFLDQLRQTGILDGITVVFGSTRGYPLGEHGIVGEFDNLYNETLHVPLMVRRVQTAGPQFGTRVNQLTQFRELNQIVRELSVGKGLSLKPKVASISSVAQLRSLQNEQWKLIHSTNEDIDDELYAKPDDRWDVNDVSRRCADVVQELREKLLNVPE